MSKNKIIAIDGFSSCGKSTLAKALARKLNFLFVDSGAMYRAVTLYFLRNKIDLQNESQIKQAIEDIHIDLIPQGDTTQVLLNDEDISIDIRQMEVSEYVSEVSAIPLVRRAMVSQQQKLGARRNIVMDGRDIGTTVFPNATLKIFMTASPEIRSERRFNELKAKGESVTMEEVVRNLAHRDHIDSTREESPLRQADDAILLDNTALSPDDQLAFVIEKFQKIQ